MVGKNVVRACIRDMQAYIPGDAAEDAAVVKLNQNENRYPPSPRAVKAIESALAGVAIYPESTSRTLREAAATVYDVPVDHVIAGNGSDDILRILFHCCCNPGDVAVAFHPTYSYYATLAAMHDVRYRLIDFEGEYRLPDSLNLDDAKLVFLPNPNAPTGTVFPEAEIRRLLQAVPNGLVVVDEAYADFCAVTAMPLLREFDNLVIVRTFSKSYSLAGLRVGLGFARPELLAELEKVRDFYNVDRLAQAGAEAALLDQDWLRYIAGKVAATRDATITALRELGLTVYDSGANFVLVRFPSAARAREIYEGLRSRNVLVRYFDTRGIDDCLRVSIGTDTDMDVFKKELEALLE
ncbi:MAG: histidinol-phosphate transaminase [Planctomycetaceae bacterium]|nr:histidinol-phosphate transaminase [Planctomycetaceae bacterium]